MIFPYLRQFWTNVETERKVPTVGAIIRVACWRKLSIFKIVSHSITDPDPPGSEIIWPQGSGSGSEIINFGSRSGSGSFPISHQT